MTVHYAEQCEQCGRPGPTNLRPRLRVRDDGRTVVVVECSDGADCERRQIGHRKAAWLNVNSGQAA